MGDLIAANTSLITINPLSPVWVNFAIPQNQLTLLLHYQHSASLDVKILAEDNQQLLGIGKLVFVDNTVNQQTGTILLKAELANLDQHLWPGQLVTVQLILAVEAKALTIPVSAVQLDQEGSFVYQVQGHKAKVQRIKIDRQINDLVVVSEGLKINDEVLITIPPNFSEQEPITIQSTTR